MELIRQGTIVYEISIVVPDKSPGAAFFSDDWRLTVLQHNIAASKEVFFDGKRSRSNTVNTDYGYKSAVSILADAGSDKYTYCKEFPYFNFCLSLNSLLPSGNEYARPIIELTDEYAEIAGYKCRKAIIETAGSIKIVFFTDHVSIQDPTYAVLQQEGIDGFILQQEEMPPGKGAWYFLRYKVKTVDFTTAIPGTVFETPSGYTFFNDIDEVRKENRKIMQEETQQVWAQTPLTDAEKNRFNGYWLLEAGEDKMIMEITNTGSPERWENKYSATTYFIPEKDTIRKTVEEARLWKNSLLVEEPPNYRLYELDLSKNTITWSGNNIFTFKQIEKQEADNLLNHTV